MDQLSYIHNHYPPPEAFIIPRIQYKLIIPEIDKKLFKLAL